jgi:hypothetical protein
LWQILLREPSNDLMEQQGSEPSSEGAETNDTAAHARSGKEMAMSQEQGNPD